MSTVIIQNGNGINIGSFSGTVSICGDQITVDGKPVDLRQFSQNKAIELHVIVNGDCGSVSNVSGSVTINGDCGNVSDIAGTVRADAITGNVTNIAGSVHCKK